MYWPDVIDVKNFYSSPLGLVACRIIRKAIRKVWTDVNGEVILGIGYATPYLLPFLDEAQSVYGYMPASQGVIHWPPNRMNLTLMGDEAELPFQDNSIDRVILAHACENSEQVNAMLEEIWRILMPGGKVLVIAPNRSGIWSRFDSTPFGHGTPYSKGQLSKILEVAQFSVLSQRSMLYMPPASFKMILKLSNFFESMGAKMRGLFGGLLLAEAEKQVYAVMPLRKVARTRKYSYITVPRPVLNNVRR